MTTTLNKHDLAWCLKRLPSPVVKELTERAGKLFLAGGFIRDIVTREKPSDVDLFAPTVDAAEATARALADKTQGTRVVRTDNAFTVLGMKMPVQVIHRWTFEKAADCVASFDFTIACAAIWRGEAGWETACDDDFYTDLAAKRLVYRHPVRNEDAGGSMLRVLKFYQRGYCITMRSLGGVIARMMQGVKPSGVHIHDENALAKVLCGLLREVDPNVDPDHLSHIPDLDEEQPPAPAATPAEATP